MKQDKLFCVSQKVVIEKNGKVLVVYDPLMGIDLPGGKIQEGETDFNEALRREVREETGLEIIIGKPFATNYFEVPLLIKGKKHANSGKKVYTVFFTAQYSSGQLTLSQEHNRYEWVGKEEYKELIKGEKSTIKQALQAYFTQL